MKLLNTFVSCSKMDTMVDFLLIRMSSRCSTRRLTQQNVHKKYKRVNYFVIKQKTIKNNSIETTFMVCFRKQKVRLQTKNNMCTKQKD